MCRTRRISGTIERSLPVVVYSFSKRHRLLQNRAAQHALRNYLGCRAHFFATRSVASGIAVARARCAISSNTSRFQPAGSGDRISGKLWLLKIFAAPAFQAAAHSSTAVDLCAGTAQTAPVNRRRRFRSPSARPSDRPRHRPMHRLRPYHQ